MFRVQSLVVPLGLMLCLLSSHETAAQQLSDTGVVYEAARNKIGLIRYCRNVGLLDPAVADQAVIAVETGLLALPSSDGSAREEGDRAQRAGEDGFWETGRRRDIASIATLFHTTPADLCQEWAEETLRGQTPKPYREVKTITVTAPAPRPIPPLQQPEATPFGRIWEEAPPARAAPEVKAVRADPLPPLPQRAPLLPPPAKSAAVLRTSSPAEPASPERTLPQAKSAALLRTLPQAAPASPQRTLPPGEPAALQRSSPAGDDVASIDSTESEPADAPDPSRQALPLSGRLAAEAGPLPSEQTVAGTSSGSYERPRSRIWEAWPFNRLGKPRRCLMAGCRWPTAEERRASQ